MAVHPPFWLEFEDSRTASEYCLGSVRHPSMHMTSVTLSTPDVAGVWFDLYLIWR